MQNMGNGVMSLDQSAPIRIHGNADRLARFRAAAFQQRRAMNEDLTPFLRISDSKLPDLGAIVSGNMQQTMVAHLSAHFGVAWRMVESDVWLVVVLSRQNSLHDCFRLKKIITEKSRRRGFQLSFFDADFFLFLCLSRTLTLFLHQFFEAGNIDCET